MLLTREYRKMGEAEAIELLPSQDISGDHGRLAMAIDNLPQDFFAKAVTDGWMTATDIRLNGISQYRIYWQKRGDGTILHVHASLLLASGNIDDMLLWGEGVDRMAAMNGCHTVTFSTARKGHVMQAQCWGARVTGVTMEKNYD